MMDREEIDFIWQLGRSGVWKTSVPCAEEPVTTHTRTFPLTDIEKVFAQALSACWQEFDPEDETTFPENGRYWVWTNLFQDGFPMIMFFNGQYWFENPELFDRPEKDFERQVAVHGSKTVTHYMKITPPTCPAKPRRSGKEQG